MGARTVTAPRTTTPTATAMTPRSWAGTTATTPTRRFIRARRTTYDGIDSDCDGASEYDVDGDGFLAERSAAAIATTRAPSPTRSAR